MLSFLGALLYRLGGIGKPYPAKTRDVGVSLVALFYILTLNSWNNWYLLHFALLWLALSTYWKFLNKFFKKPDTDCFWFNWLFHGIGCGLAALPLVFAGFGLFDILIRTLFLGVLCMVWSEVINEVTAEELGRGYLIIATLELL